MKFQSGRSVDLHREEIRFKEIIHDKIAQQISQNLNFEISYGSCM